MSSTIAEAINRLLGIKNDIIAALIEKEIDATGHNMEDFAEDIRNIEGLDIKSTTATAGDVLSGKKFFDKDKVETTGTLILNEVTPGSEEQTLAIGSNYKMNDNGILINELKTITPSATVQSVDAGFIKLLGSAAIYNEKQSFYFEHIVKQDIPLAASNVYGSFKITLSNVPDALLYIFTSKNGSGTPVIRLFNKKMSTSYIYCGASGNNWSNGTATSGSTTAGLIRRITNDDNKSDIDGRNYSFNIATAAGTGPYKFECFAFAYV